jgi:hypothetical protein
VQIQWELEVTNFLHGSYPSSDHKKFISADIFQAVFYGNFEQKIFLFMQL